MTDNSELAEQLWCNGVGHLKGAQAIVSFSKDFAISEGIDDVDKFVFNGPYSQSAHFLIGFSLELIIKSTFLFLGGAESALREFGHDIASVLAACEDSGLEVVDDDFRKLVKLVSDPHKRLEFRYGTDRNIPLPSLEKTLELAELFAADVQSAFGEKLT